MRPVHWHLCRVCRNLFLFMNNTITGPSTLRSDPVHTATHPTEPDVPENLALDNPQAVSDAYVHLRECPALADFCELAFVGADADTSRDALITLILYRCAHERQQSTGAIDQSRERALATVAERLSPVSQEELLQTLDSNAAPSAFCRYLAEADRLCLAGHVYVAQGKARHSTENFVRAAQTYAAAAQSYLLMNEPGQAAEAYQQCALAYWSASLTGEALEALTMAADTLVQGNLLDLAKRDYATVIREYETWATELKQAGLHEQAEHANNAALAIHNKIADLHCRRAAECLQQNLGWKAASKYSKAAMSYTNGGQHLRAAQCEQEAAKILLASEAPESAARHLVAAACAYGQAKEYPRCVGAFEKATAIYAQKNMYHQLKSTYPQLAQAWAVTDDPERHLHMAKAFLAATEACMRLHAQEAEKAGRRSVVTVYQNEAKNNYTEAVAARDAACTPQTARAIGHALLKFAQVCTKARWPALAGAAYADVAREKQAIEAFENAVDLCLEEPRRDDAADTWLQLGDYLMAWGSYRAAEQVFQKAAELREEQVHGVVNWVKTGEAWERVAYACATQGRRELELEDALSKAKAAYEHAGPPIREVRRYWGSELTLYRAQQAEAALTTDKA